MAVQPWIRRAVIRGDFSAVGLWAILLVALGCTVAALAPEWMSDWGIGGSIGWGLGLGMMVLGIVAIRFNRRRYAVLLAEVVDRFAGYEPGNSPVPWISDALWKERNGFDRMLDGPVELQAEVDTAVRSFHQDATGALTLPTLRPVSEAERSVAPGTPDFVSSVSESRAEVAELSVLEQQLRDSPGRFVVLQPVWPVCCQRLATLESVVRARREESALYLPPPGIDLDLTDISSGAHLYHCRCCGRWYASDTWW